MTCIWCENSARYNQLWWGFQNKQVLSASVYSAGVHCNWFWWGVIFTPQFYGASYCCSRSLPSCIYQYSFLLGADNISDVNKDTYTERSRIIHCQLLIKFVNHCSNQSIYSWFGRAYSKAFCKDWSLGLFLWQVILTL